MLTEPVIALTVEFTAIVSNISPLVLKCCCISHVFAMRFAFNSSSRVMPPFTAAAAINLRRAAQMVAGLRRRAADVPRDAINVPAASVRH